jgi:hypothetical protein
MNPLYFRASACTVMKLHFKHVGQLFVESLGSNICCVKQPVNECLRKQAFSGRFTQQILSCLLRFLCMVNTKFSEILGSV